MSRFSRGSAASPGGGFLGDSLQGSPHASLKFPVSAKLYNSLEGPGVEAEPAPVELVLNDRLEAAQAQDWKWNRKQEKEGGSPRVLGEREEENSRDGRTVGKSVNQQPHLPNINSKSEIPRTELAKAPALQPALNQPASSAGAGAAIAGPAVSHPQFTDNVFHKRDRFSVVSGELVVGRGPQCGPIRVKPEVLERIRARDRSRSP
jgi:hypothetical protein